jgi:tetratricopeptide (TPR) repeat protein
MAVVNLSEKNDDLKSQAGAFRRVGRVQRRQGRWRQARQTLNRAARLFRVLEDDAGEAETHLNLGNIEFEQGNYEKAERAYNRALRFSRNLNLPNMTGNINLSLGAVYQARGGLAEAITHFSASLKAFEEVGDRPRIGMAHFNLGITHRDYGSWVRSGMSMEESLKIAEQTRNIGLLGMVYLRRAETQIMLSDATMAMIYGRRAMRVFVQLDDPLGQGDVYRIYGLAAGLRQAWRQAFEYLNRGLELQRQYTCPLGEAEASEALGGVYEQMNDRTNAISWYEKALGLYQDLGAGKDEQRVRETLKNARSGAA